METGKVINIEDHGDAFDWAWALWYWGSHNYEGQSCPKYLIMNIAHDYSMTNIPDIDFNNNDCDEYENAVMYYHEINEENWEAVLKEFCRYMDDDWEKDAC